MTDDNKFICNSSKKVEQFTSMIRQIWEDSNHYVTFSWIAGKNRSREQNMLAFELYKTLWRCKPETFPELDDARAHCKLHYGVPVMLETSDAYAKTYLSLIEDRYSYEEKLEIMVSPATDHPVTRIMTTKQFNEYVARIERGFPDVHFEALDD